MKTHEQTRLLAITNDAGVLNAIENALKEEPEYLLVDNSILSKGISQAVRDRQPDVVIFDYKYESQNAYDAIDKIASQFPTCAVLVLLSEEQIKDSYRVILAGARAFLQTPFSPEDFLTTLHRVVELLTRVPAPTKTPTQSLNRPKNTFVVFSPKGGVGCTTTAVNLSIALKKVVEDDVLLIDGKHMFGHVTLMLNIRTANSISDLIAHAGMLDATLIRQVVGKHVSGIHVLPSPLALSEGQGIRPDELFKVIQALQNVYPNIIVDGGNHIDENTVTYMDSADRVILVMTPNLASLRDARQFLEVARNTLSYPPGKIMLVLNQVGYKTDVKKEEIERILQMKLAGTIPADENAILGSLNDGIPILLKNPRHAVSLAFLKLAGQVGEIIKANNQAQPESKAAHAEDILVKSSRLG